MKLSNSTITSEKLADAIIAKYIKYPTKTTAFINTNYCILPDISHRIFRPFLRAILTPFCD